MANSFATNETIADTTSISNMSVTPPRVLSDDPAGKWLPRYGMPDAPLVLRPLDSALTVPGLVPDPFFPFVNLRVNLTPAPDYSLNPAGASPSTDSWHPALQRPLPARRSP